MQVGSARCLKLLDLRAHPNGRTYYLREPVEYQNGLHVIVPAGFETDFASVPRPFWSFISPTGDHGPAAVLHDWLYWEQERAGVTREQADEIFLEVMAAHGVLLSKRRAMYRAVRIFGGSAWRKNARDRAAGVIRVHWPLPEEFPPSRPRGIEGLWYLVNGKKAA